MDKFANEQLRQLEPIDLYLKPVGMRCSIWCRANRDVVADVGHTSLERRAGRERHTGLRKMNKARRACLNAICTIVTLRFIPSLP